LLPPQDPTRQIRDARESCVGRDASGRRRIPARHEFDGWDPAVAGGGGPNAAALLTRPAFGLGACERPRAVATVSAHGDLVRSSTPPLLGSETIRLASKW